METTAQLDELLERYEFSETDRGTWTYVHRSAHKDGDSFLIDVEGPSKEGGNWVVYVFEIMDNQEGAREGLPIALFVAENGPGSVVDFLNYQFQRFDTDCGENILRS